MKKIFILQICLLIISACEKSSLTTATDSVNRPVVEGYLSPGINPAVRITRQLVFGSSDTVIHAIQDLNIVMETDGMAYPLTYSAADTAYVADGNWQVKAGKTYRMSFSYAGGTVSAAATIPPEPVSFAASASSIVAPQFTGNPGSGGGPPTFPDPIKLTWENNDASYYLVVVENIEADPEAIFQDNGTGRPPRPTFRSEPEQTNTYDIGFQSFEYYGTHRIILYRLNADYATLYDNNGNSSQNLTAPYSNISGGLGIFTGLNSDTLMLEVTK